MTNMRTFCIVLALAACLVLPIGAVAAQPYPVPNAFVHVSGSGGSGSTQSGTNGSFMINTGLATGSDYSLTISKVGYIDAMVDNINIISGQVTNLGNILMNVSAKITGTVHTPSGNPASSIIVTLYDQSGLTVSTGAITGSDGTFSIDTNVPTGTYTIVTNVLSGNYASSPNMTGISAVEGQTTNVGVLTLTQSGTISGTVTGSGDGGIGGISVSAINVNGATGFIGSALTDATGHYSINSNLPTGTYHVGIFGTATGYIVNESDVQTVSVTAGSTYTVNFVLPISGSIQGKVTYANGNPAPNVAVEASSNSGFFGLATTGSDGTYDINAGLGTGSYTVIAGFDFLSAQTASVTAGSETTGVNFQLGYNVAFISGTVKSGSTPLDGASLVGQFTGGSGAAPTAADGSYRMEINIPSGQNSVSVTVTASDDGYNSSSQVVTATVGQTTSNVNFNLQAIVIISGTLEGVVVSNTPPPLQSATLSIAPSSNSLGVGSQLTLSGTISPSQTGTITIYQSINGSTSTVLTTVNLASGAYTYAFSPSSVGNFSFYSSWPGNSQYNPAQSSSIQVRVTSASLQTATLSIQTSSSNVVVNSSVTLSGTLSPSRSGTVTIYQSFNGSGFTALTMPTLSSGSYSYTFSPSELGTYQYYAYWPGDSQTTSANSSTITVSATAVAKTTPTLTLQSSANNPSVPSYITLSGTISPSASGNVAISLNVNNTGFHDLTTATLNNGAFSSQYYVISPGTYQFQASFAGNDQLNSAQSSTVTVTTAGISPYPDYTLYIIILIVVIIVIIIIYLVWRMMMRPKPKPGA